MLSTVQSSIGDIMKFKISINYHLLFDSYMALKNLVSITIKINFTEKKFTKEGKFYTSYVTVTKKKNIYIYD